MNGPSTASLNLSPFQLFPLSTLQRVWGQKDEGRRTKCGAALRAGSGRDIGGGFDKGDAGVVGGEKRKEWRKNEKVETGVGVGLRGVFAGGDCGVGVVFGGHGPGLEAALGNPGGGARGAVESGQWGAGIHGVVLP